MLEGCWCATVRLMIAIGNTRMALACSRFHGRVVNLPFSQCNRHNSLDPDHGSMSRLLLGVVLLLFPSFPKHGCLFLNSFTSRSWLLVTCLFVEIPALRKKGPWYTSAVNGNCFLVSFSALISNIPKVANQHRLQHNRLASSPQQCPFRYPSGTSP